MKNTAPEWFMNLQTSDLEPIVRQVLDRPAVESFDWHIQPLSGGAGEYTGRGFGVYQITGTAYSAGHALPWSTVVKVVGPSDRADFNDPSNVDYWRREVLAYQSGILEQLPGEIIVPRCYTIHELTDGKLCIWIEAVHEADGSWAMEEHRLVARHFGQFNGAYLAGHPLPPKASWLLSGRTEQWLENSLTYARELSEISTTNLGRWLSNENINRMAQLFEQRRPLLAALDRLPICFCHHDAFRRNLILRQTEDGNTETVALDWSYAGLGKVGQEMGVAIALNLLFMEVSGDRARELDQAIFAGYSAGLRDAGWKGDLQLARFGYTVTAASTFGVAFGARLANRLRSPDGAATLEAMIGRSIDDILRQLAALLPFMLNLGDEALAMMPSI